MKNNQFHLAFPVETERPVEFARNEAEHIICLHVQVAADGFCTF